MSSAIKGTYSIIRGTRGAFRGIDGVIGGTSGIYGGTGGAIRGMVWRGLFLVERWIKSIFFGKKPYLTFEGTALFVVKVNHMADIKKKIE